jgi:hypothetical protein
MLLLKAKSVPLRFSIFDWAEQRRKKRKQGVIHG